MPTDIVTSVVSRKGRGPGWVKFRSGAEASTFDPDILHRAQLAVEGNVPIEYTIEERSGKDGKIYKNISSLAVLHDTTGLTQPATAEIPAVPADLGSLPYLLFDRADDEAVIARLKGQIVKAYVYHFQQGGQDVYGLGVDGAEACKRELAKHGEVIEENDVRIEKDEPRVSYFKAYASRWAVNKNGQRIELDSTIGTKRQEKFYSDGRPNPFWFEQGCTKAMRNAILRLTPEEIKLRIIEIYKQEARQVVVKDAPQRTEEDRAVEQETPQPLLHVFLTLPQNPPQWLVDFTELLQKTVKEEDVPALQKILGQSGYESLQQIPDRQTALGIWKEMQRAINDRKEKK